MKHLDLFSGIGGFALAAERVWPRIDHIFCDNDLFCQEVLKKHWPHSKIYGDIRELKGNEIGTVDLITGGFPCQPFSQAGKQRGTADDRDLWPEMFRVIQETRPHWIVGENVGGFVNMELERTISNLESEGYEVEAIIIPALAVGAPHRRDRVWIIAHNESGSDRRYNGKSKERQAPKYRNCIGQRDDSNSRFKSKRKSFGTRNETRTSEKFTGRNKTWDTNWLEVAAELCRVDDGIPTRLDRTSRLKALGNAIVPQVAEEIFKAIKLTHS